MANPQLEMRRKNKEFVNKVRSNKSPVNFGERSAFKSPLGQFAIGLLVFVICAPFLLQLVHIIFG